VPRTLRNVVISSAIGIVLMVTTGISVGAATQPPTTTGQPGAPTNTCGSPGGTSTPGASASSKGAPFNSSGQAGVVYAGNPMTASLGHSNSTVAVSQYDVACFQVTGH
jgi:hypothetical protein